ncbi:Hypp5600 [Branchiostoma lanceolatum]|uniref:Hypp5600 protein n=1 Tax=Branchiostoma lanceolatum TaxID=7740 RepID=A0A8J9YN89_BRALA|nr:Hypp5600 [Branchiostoma lanceolatum]
MKSILVLIVILTLMSETAMGEVEKRSCHVVINECVTPDGLDCDSSPQDPCLCRTETICENPECPPGSTSCIG